ncbi:Unannotated [Lentimonas sp. CC4]|nr:Unannotated [Lentimonas sp. CC4]CAA6686756.1 Unannotated [Lentimonas sp. CC6]CAA7075666.1 Unannotated [Lentimonas sp. CC4]CAA7168175.1 Unannotated [Lentimonas sp. CC21]CAA7181673.1 Unannotated [Lentimonas sp. CC8]
MPSRSLSAIPKKAKILLRFIRSFGVTAFTFASLITSTSSSWWARWGSNPRPRDYESPALTAELQAQKLCSGLREKIDSLAESQVLIAPKRYFYKKTAPHSIISGNESRMA